MYEQESKFNNRIYYQIIWYFCYRVITSIFNRRKSTSCCNNSVWIWQLFALAGSAVKMNPIQYIPTLIATISLGYASFIRNRIWAVLAFIVWFFLFVLLLKNIGIFQ